MMQLDLRGFKSQLRCVSKRKLNEHKKKTFLQIFETVIQLNSFDHAKGIINDRIVQDDSIQHNCLVVFPREINITK